MEKRRNNKGFSLVELIVVVAIMAVLMTVLAPQLLRYVEKTRLQKDNSAISEIANAIKIAAADERINAEIVAATPSGGITLTADQDSTTFVQSFDVTDITDVGSPAAPTMLETELEGIFPEDVRMTSNTYNDDGVTELEITITVNSNNVVQVVVDNWADVAGAPTSSHTF